MSLADALLEPLDGDAFEPTPRALELARWFLLDTLSVGLAGSAIAADFVAPFAGTLQHLSAPGPSAAFAAGARLVPHAAAAVNAASVHTLDFDDSYLSGVKAHLSTSVVPAALAVSAISPAWRGACTMICARPLKALRLHGKVTG